MPDQYDFVVVGAGAAGCVLADRLSASGKHTVALIEAGGRDTHPLIHVPAGVGWLIGHRQLDWGYRTVAQEHANGRTIPLPRGRVLGGCTSTNGMVYFRGHPADYDEWRDLGCTGWSYEDVLPYFVSQEANGTFSGPDHGQEGPVHVSSYRRVNPLTRSFMAAADELGFSQCDDFNSGVPEGFGIRQAMIRRGRRESAVTAFLKRARGRRNLHVLDGMLADRIGFSGKRAVGVELVRGNQRVQIGARCGVILSAGSFGSPAILQRSGIGDAARLAGLGLKALVHSPQVGGNLQDHVVAPVQMATPSGQPYVADWRVLPRLAANAIQYAVCRAGPLASNVFEAAGFVRTSHAGPRPDIQMIFMPMHRAPGPFPRKRGFGILVALLRPQSRGRVDIASLAPDAHPLIDPSFLSSPDDMAPLVDGVRTARRMLGANAFSGLAATELLPGADVQSDPELAEAIRQNCATVHHPVGTCRMGRDEAAVTDCELRVRGVDGLWVADASIMPRLVGGNTAAPVYMIAAKAGAMILNSLKS